MGAGEEMLQSEINGVIVCYKLDDDIEDANCNVALGYH